MIRDYLWYKVLKLRHKSPPSLICITRCTEALDMLALSTLSRDYLAIILDEALSTKQQYYKGTDYLQNCKATIL